MNNFASEALALASHRRFAPLEKLYYGKVKPFLTHKFSRPHFTVEDQSIIMKHLWEEITLELKLFDIEDGSEYKTFLDGVYLIIYGRLIKKYEAKVVAYIYRRTSDLVISEDLAADTFFKMLNAIRNKKAWAKSFSGWLYRIAHNLIIDHYRKRERVAKVSVPIEELEHVEELRESPLEAVDHKLDIEASFEKVVAAIRTISPEQQQVIQLRHFEDYSFGEIAEKMGKTEGAVKGLLHRGLEALRVQLAVKELPAPKITVRKPPRNVFELNGTPLSRAQDLVSVMVDSYPLPDAVGYHGLSLESLKVLIEKGRLYSGALNSKKLEHIPVNIIHFPKNSKDLNAEQLESMLEQANLEQQKYFLASLLKLEPTRENILACFHLLKGAYFNEKLRRIVMRPHNHGGSLNLIRSITSLSDEVILEIIQSAKQRTGILLSFSRESLAKHKVKVNETLEDLVIDLERGIPHSLFTGLYTTDEHALRYLEELKAEVYQDAETEA